MMEGIDRVYLEPDIVLPSHLLSRPIETPEKRLLLAVLEEAVGTLQRYVFATDPHSRVIFTDVEAWFASEETARLYSFVGICDALGIDAAYVRSGLARWLDTHRTPSLGTPQPIYRFPFRRVNGTRHRTNGRAPGLPRRDRGAPRPDRRETHGGAGSVGARRCP